MKITQYDPTTGRILSVTGFAGIEPDAIESWKQPEFGYVEAEADVNRDYVADGAVVPRPASPVTISGLTLHDVPAGARVIIDGTAYEADGTVELEFPLPGTFNLRVECFPYLEWSGDVTVPVVSGAEP